MIPLNLVPRDQRWPGVISILLPSRRRPGKLRDCIATLYDLAARPDLLELLVAYDPDDLATAKTAALIGAHTIWRAPERYGHAGVAHYYAALLDRCHGEWMVPWNDDAYMVTPGWDEKVRRESPMVLGNLDNSGHNCFPFIHLDLFHTLGRHTSHPAIDTWYTFVGQDTGLYTQSNINIRQERPDLGNCDPDETYVEGRVDRSGEFFREPFTIWRAEDTAMLMEARCAVS